jgi:hypothetical protein
MFANLLRQTLQRVITTFVTAAITCKCEHEWWRDLDGRALVGKS